jgi:hypothetical protein
MLIFALLEQNLDHSSLEKIENHFRELEGWSDLGKADAHAIAARMASGYHELYNRAPSDSSFRVTPGPENTATNSRIGLMSI